MTDQELELMLKNEALKDFKPDFEDLKRRIEKEPKNTASRAAGFGRFIRAAAACVVLAAVAGAVLLAVSSGGRRSYSEASYEEDYVDLAPVMQEAEASEDISESEEPGVIEDYQQSDGAVYEGSSGVGDTAASASNETYYIREMDMYISLPAIIPTTDREVSEEFAKMCGTTADELLAHYIDQNVYFNALWQNGEVVSELTVSQSGDDYTYQVFDLSKASDIQKSVIRAGFELYTSEDSLSAGTAFRDIEEFESGKLLFIKANCTVNNSLIYENRRVYMTVVNGKRVTITLIEHYPAGEDVDTSEYPTEITTDDEDVITAAVRSVRFGRIRSKFLARYKYLLVLAGLSVIAAAVLAVWLDKRNKRVRLKREALEKADKPEDGEPDVLPNKTEEETKEE